MQVPQTYRAEEQRNRNNDKYRQYKGPGEVPQLLPDHIGFDIRLQRKSRRMVPWVVAPRFRDFYVFLLFFQKRIDHCV